MRRQDWYWAIGLMTLAGMGFLAGFAIGGPGPNDSESTGSLTEPVGDTSRSAAPANSEEAPRDHGTGTPDIDRDESGLIWADQKLEIAIEQAAAVEVDVEFETLEPLASAYLSFDEAIKELVGVETLQIGDLSTGSLTIPITVSAPQDAPQDLQINGEISLSGEAGALGTSLPVAVRVTPLNSERAARQLRIPSRNQIVETSVGAIVRNQISVFIDGGADFAAEVAASHGATLVGSSPEAGLYQFQVKAADSWVESLDIAESLSDDQRILHASPSSLTGALSLPNDERWRAAWNQPSASDETWHMEQVKLPTAWALRNNDWESTAVAVLDVGFDLTHEDLTFSATNGRMRLHADKGHGTHVAGTACADSNNGLGVAGAGWDCDLRAFNVFVSYSDYDDGFRVRVDNDRLYEAMVLAARDGARVVNLSLGYEFKGDPEICMAIDDLDTPVGRHALNDYVFMGLAIRHANSLAEQDVLWVTAAGNDSCGASMVWPASVARIPEPLTSYLGTTTYRQAAATTVAVTATNRDQQLSEYSNRSPSTTVAAPGGAAQMSRDAGDPGVHSTTACSAIPVSVALVEPGPCRSYGYLNGTSMAAPLVTGIASMMFSSSPELPASEAKKCLMYSAHEHLLPDSSLGVVDATKAVECASEWPRFHYPDAYGSQIVARWGVNGPTDYSLEDTEARGSGCTPGQNELSDGVWFGFVNDIAESSVSFDLGCWLSGDAAVQASGGNPGESNYYFVVNDNPATRSVPLSESARFFLHDRYVPGFGHAEYDRREFSALDVGKIHDHIKQRPWGMEFWSENVGVWVLVEGGEAVEVLEFWFGFIS
jgi:subtilisin family serine protease